MLFEFDARPSDSPFVEEVWHARNERPGSFHSIASTHWGMVVTLRNGKATMTVRGPQTKATILHCEPDGEWVGIWFRVGSFMPNFPVSALVDNDPTLPGAGLRTFYLDGSVWQVPDYENADTFVDRLERKGLLVREPLVDAAMLGQLNGLSERSIQRRFLRAAGLTQRTVRQIERARAAMALLQRGVSILDTVHEVGFYDQPHMTRSLKYLLGQTPAEIAANAASE